MFKLAQFLANNGGIMRMIKYSIRGSGRVDRT